LVPNCNFKTKITHVKIGKLFANVQKYESFGKSENDIDNMILRNDSD